MKKLYTLAFALIVAAASFSKEVSKQSTLLVAKNFLSQALHRPLQEQSLQLTYAYRSNSGKPLYDVYTLTDQTGFVIVASDDVVQPILGYSSEGSFDPAYLPPPVKAWLKGYEEEIESAQLHFPVASPEVASKW